jgi:polar amino acid transport system substrate-binding protein
MKTNFFAILFIAIFINFNLFSTEYKAAIPQLSPQATATYSNLVKAIFEATGNTIAIQVVPFARSINLVEEKQVDMQFPQIVIPDAKMQESLSFDYSTDNILDQVFVLYTNKSKPILKSDLEKGNKKFRIETDIAHTNHFNFNISGSPTMDASLKKVDSGAIDGYIFAQNSTDITLKNMGLKNIKREKFGVFECKFTLLKGTKGGDIDKLISKGLKIIKDNGKFQKIMDSTVKSASTYIEWQP